MRFLVTAGNTRERIDEVRDWGNIFTGGTGFAIAKALAELGPVDLLTSNRQHLAEARADFAQHIDAAGFTTHADLLHALESRMHTHAYDAVFMTAAVADYRPERVFEVIERKQDPGDAKTEVWIVRDVQAGKVRSSYKSIAVLGKQTDKIVDMFRSAWGYKGILVKFKLEVGIGVEELLRIGENSRLASGADYLVANTLDMLNGAGAGAYLLRAGGHEWVPRPELPQRMVQLVREAT